MSYDYQQAWDNQAKVTMLPNRATSRLIRAKRDEESGRVAWDVPQEAQPTCVLCGLVGGDAHMVRGQVMHAHAHCVAALQRKLGQTTKPVHKAIPTTPTSAATDTDTQARDIVVKAIAENGMVREAVARGLARRLAGR